MFSHEPVDYEVPVISTRKQQQQPDAAQYSVVKPVKKNKNGDNKRDEDGNTLCLSTSPTLDNPVYMTGCAAAAGGLDHQYSSHQRLVRISCCVDHLTPVLAEIAGVVLLVVKVLVVIP